jgi:hypothetical protein
MTLARRRVKAAKTTTEQLVATSTQTNTTNNIFEQKTLGPGDHARCSAVLGFVLVTFNYGVL